MNKAQKEAERSQMDAFYEAAKQLSPPVAAALAAVEPGLAVSVTEIRLRCGQPVTLQTMRGTLLLTKTGHVRMSPASDLLITTFSDIQNCFYAVCGYSVHSVQHALTHGYVPLAGGHRAGICGTAVLNNEGDIINVRRITSMNVRVARPVCAECPKEVQAVLRDETVGGILFAGPPACGKTTLLRTAARVLGNAGTLVAVIDERMELCPTCATGFLSPLAPGCDVLSGYPKAAGMQQALRTLAPQTMICDEVGGMEDARAVLAAANAGVRIIASIHAQAPRALWRRPQSRVLLETGAFQTVVFLESARAPGTVRGIYDVDSLR